MSKKKGEPNSASKGRIINDIAIYLVIFLVFGFLIWSVFKNVAKEEWTKEILQIVGDACIFLLGLVGIFEFCYDNNLTFFIPSNYSKKKDEDIRKRAHEAFIDYYNSETEFISKTADERAKQILSLLKLTNNETKKAAVLKAMSDPIIDINTCKEKLMRILFDSDVIFDLLKAPAHDANPNANIRYYLQTHDLLYDKQIRENVSHIMASFIEYTIGKNYDLIMVPHSSNLYLGDELSHIVGKKMIKMIHPETARYLPFKYENRVNDLPLARVIVVHDVLFSGDQIIESINSLKNALGDRVVIVGVFCLVRRNITELRGGQTRIENLCNIYSLLELSEKDITYELELRDNA